MLQYLLRRVLYIIPTLIGVMFLVFVSVRLIPGDPAVAIAGERATPQLVEQVRREMGLDQPILVQFGRYMRGLVQGDLGRSARTNLPVSDEIGRRLPPTLLLASVSLVVAALVGIVIGVLSATPALLLDRQRGDDRRARRGLHARLLAGPDADDALFGRVASPIGLVGAYLSAHRARGRGSISSCRRSPWPPTRRR